MPLDGKERYPHPRDLGGQEKNIKLLLMFIFILTFKNTCVLSIGPCVGCVGCKLP